MKKTLSMVSIKLVSRLVPMPIVSGKRSKHLNLSVERQKRIKILKIIRLEP